MTKALTLANRLAEAVLFDWDKGEVVKLAKEVAVACKEEIDFIFLFKRMREAQKDYDVWVASFDSRENIEYRKYKMERLQSEVDEVLKRWEEKK